ncbi:MAG: hypothetical protein BWX88_00908 [Planctomycetes bacterium ADurb.Bin126]|nr:MAG: hypothetical protein BWX88_00908 [Planctomycetes bacterium ADurb.Bin126]HOD82579.1 toll/interleukin-1 receptor domain-containing protein [Phycisphaerae bacterium]HQL74173.1 toll/interleukin-1 receptor domain-containing protein [Phycisphaerae bacterium]
MDDAAKTIFISYARKDAARIQPILDVLRKRGFHIWMDTEGIEGSDIWRQKIVQAIKACCAVLFFATRRSCGSRNVSKELAIADDERKPILPVFLEDGKISDELRYQLAGRQYVRWNDNPQATTEIVDVLTHRTGHSPVNAFPSLPFVATGPTSGRRRRRHVLLMAGGMVTVIAAATLLVISKPWRHPSGPLSDVAPVPATTAEEPPPVEAQELPPSPLPTLQGNWFIESTTLRTSYNPYIGIRVRYQVSVFQDGSALEVQGEKVGEVVDGEERKLTGRGRTGIRLRGRIVPGAGAPPTIALTGEEESTKKAPFATSFELRVQSSDVLVGAFSSTAASASGTVVWISERKWRQTGWSGL